MASKAVMDAVAARLSGWSSLSSCPLADINDVATSPRARFLQVEYPVATEERLDIGMPGLFRESGGVRFVVNVRTGDGITSAAALVEELRDRFREWQSGAVEMLGASPAVYDERNRRGVFYEVPFVVLYQYDYQKEPQP